MLKRLCPNGLQLHIYFFAALPWLLLSSRTLADISVVSVAAHFIWRSYHHQQWQWLKQTWCIAAGLFFLYLATIHSAHSAAPLDSLVHSLYFLRWPLFACALACHLRATPIRHVFLISLLTASAALMLDCMWQFFHGSDLLGHTTIGQRLTGPYHAPLPGIMLLRVLFVASLCFALSQRPQRFAWQWCWWVLALTVLMMSGERMALLLCLLGISCVLSMLIYGQTQLRQQIIWMSLSLLSILALLAALDADIAQRMVWSLLQKLEDFPHSDYGKVFRVAMTIWQAHPWLGHGLHTYQQACTATGLLQSWGMFCSHPHNLYLLLLSETGLIGCTLFISMVAALYLSILRPLYLARQWWLLGNQLAVLSVCFFPLIGGISVWNNWVAALVWMGAGVSLAISQSVAFVDCSKHCSLDQTSSTLRSASPSHCQP